MGSSTPERAEAADHNDPPDRVVDGDRAADIGDLYAWATPEGKTVIVLTYAGPVDPVDGQTAVYDADVLYGIHIDNDDDQAADHDIYVRFGQNASGNWGIQVEGIPGGDPATQAGPVAFQNSIDGVTDGFFWVGLREDPFFFDLTGFQETFSTGTLSFVNDRDFFAGKNISAIVIELETEDLSSGAFDVWATTSRIGA
ncbi:MAG: DUF4331 family protein [Myxococcota bacterium]|nr:DUF4331 family protein [Myxococcota bacterium]